MPSNVIRLVAQAEEKPKKKSMRIAPDADPFAVAKEREESKSDTSELRSTDEINQLVTYFLERGETRNALFVVLGVNTGLRPADLLEFTWEQLLGDKELVKVERKTGKVRSIILNQAIREMVDLHLESIEHAYELQEYVFVSQSNRKGHVPVGYRNMKEGGNVYHIKVQPLRERAVAQIIRNAAKETGLYSAKRRICTYSLRKTALNAPMGWVDGYVPSVKLDRMTQGLEIAKALGNHSNMATTTGHYLAIQERMVDTVMDEMNFGLEAIRKYKESRR